MTSKFRFFNVIIIRKSENIKFKQGETDRILSYQYYLSSFNNCSEIKNNQVSNESLKKNYKLMWNFVQDYTGHKKDTKKY